MNVKTLFGLALFAVGCGQQKDRSGFSSYRYSELAEVKAAAHAWSAETYQDGIFTWEEGTRPNQGNGNLFGGLLCFSGDRSACSVVISLQCENKSLKRAPWRACGEYSRDELLGQSLARIVTRTKLRLPSSFPFSMTPEMWFVAWRAGASDKSLGRIYDEHALLTEAKSNPLGYRSHLIAVHLLARRESGIWNSAYQNAANTLASRQRSNMFYQWLAKGTTNGIVDAFLASVPRQRPVQRYWIWQEDDMAKMSQAHGASIEFMASILMR